MDNHRNHLMALNLRMTMASVAVATASLGASMFGMNLVNGLEAHPTAMYIVSGGLIGA